MKNDKKNEDVTDTLTHLHITKPTKQEKNSKPKIHIKQKNKKKNNKRNKKTRKQDTIIKTPLVQYK